MKTLRNLLAGLALGVALLLAGLSLAGSTATNTVYSNENMAAVAHEVASDAGFRTTMAGTLTDSVGVTGKDRAKVLAAANKVMNNPKVNAELERIVVESHKRAIGVSGAPVKLRTRVLTDPMAATLGNTRLAKVVKARSADVTLPVKTLPASSTLRIWALKVSGLWTWALGLAALALVISSNRLNVMRRVGGWMVGAGALQAALFWALPKFFLNEAHGAGAALAGKVIRAETATVATTAITLVVVGAALIIGAKLLVPLRSRMRRKPAGNWSPSAGVETAQKVGV